MTDFKQVVSTNEFPIELWRDLIAPDALWTMLRDSCAGVAAEEGHVLADDAGHPEEKKLEFVRMTELEDGGLFPMWCEEADAEHVLLRLVCWTRPR